MSTSVLAHTDRIARMLQTDAECGADPTRYAYHQREWRGLAVDFYHDAAAGASLLERCFTRPGAMTAGRADSIDDALAWMRCRHEAHAASAHRPVVGAELDFRLQIQRDALRHGEMVTATLALHDDALLWLCVQPQEASHGA